jgi:hypothetical protein
MHTYSSATAHGVCRYCTDGVSLPLGALGKGPGSRDSDSRGYFFAQLKKIIIHMHKHTPLLFTCYMAMLTVQLYAGLPSKF